MRHRGGERIPYAGMIPIRFRGIVSGADDRVVRATPSVHAAVIMAGAAPPCNRRPERPKRMPEKDAPAPLPPLDPDAVLAHCEMEFVRASGPGGQHRNRRETGVRLTHVPTGLVVMATERRSQAENRRLALERMVEKLEKRRKPRKPRKKTKKPKGVKLRERRAKEVLGERKSARRWRPRGEE